MGKRKAGESKHDIPQDELEASVRRELGEMEAAMGAESKRLEKKPSKRAKSKRSGISFSQATLRYAKDDLAGAVEIMRKAVAAADESMGDKEPYRFYMHAVLGDWVSELALTGGGAGDRAAIEEARRHIERAWAFVTTEPMGKVYLEEVRERKAKVEARLK